jgi:hypothetical protein
MALPVPHGFSISSRSSIKKYKFFKFATGTGTKTLGKELRLDPHIRTNLLLKNKPSNEIINFTVYEKKHLPYAVLV